MAFQIKLMSDLMKISPPKDAYTNQFINKKSGYGAFRACSRTEQIAVEMTTTTVVIPGIWIRVQSSATLNPVNKLATASAGMLASIRVE